MRKESRTACMLWAVGISLLAVGPLWSQNGFRGISTTSDGRIRAGLSPDHALDLLAILTHPQCRKELGVVDAQLEVIEKTKAKHSEETKVLIESSGGIQNAPLKPLLMAQMDELKSVIEEVFTYSQLQRARQLAYQIEIARVGVPYAISYGCLSDAVGVHENQRHSLLQVAEKIAEEAEVEISKIRAAAQAQILEHLVPEQREKAKVLIGKPFAYNEFALNLEQARVQFAKNASPKQ